jgi:hypothetical protein
MVRHKRRFRHAVHVSDVSICDSLRWTVDEMNAPRLRFQRTAPLN